MKPNKLIILFSLSLLFFSCSRETEVSENIEANTIVLNQTEIVTRNISCIESTNCTLPVIIISDVPDLTKYTIINAKFPSIETEEEAICIRKQYFSCFPYLRFSTLQSTTDFKSENWLLPILGDGGPIHTGGVISGTMDDDPRVCEGPTCR